MAPGISTALEGPTEGLVSGTTITSPYNAARVIDEVKDTTAEQLNGKKTLSANERQMNGSLNRERPDKNYSNTNGISQNINSASLALGQINQTIKNMFGADT